MCETWVVSFKFNVGNSWTRAISMSKATKTIDSKFTLYRLYRDPVNLPAENVVSCLPEGCPAPGKFREVQMSNITMLRLLVVLSEMLVEDIYIIVIYESIYSNSANFLAAFTLSFWSSTACLELARTKRYSRSKKQWTDGHNETLTLTLHIW